MLELPPEYLNKVASQVIMISSLLSGFSIAIIANLLVYKSDKKILNTILKATTIAAGSFLVAVFAMTKIVMLTTEGYPFNFTQSYLTLPKLIGLFAFILGIISLTSVIALSGWAKSKRIGIFTTVIGILTLLMILINL